MVHIPRNDRINSLKIWNEENCSLTVDDNYNCSILLEIKRIIGETKVIYPFFILFFSPFIHMKINT